MVKIFKRYKVVFLTLFLLIIIIGVLGAITIKESKTQNLLQKSQFRGYDVLVQSISEMENDSSIPKNARYQRMKERIMSLEDPKLTNEQKYENLIQAETNIFETYLFSRNNKVYAFNKKLDEFAKINFPEQYKKDDFNLLVCYDPACADSPQPEEILTIIEEISNSSIPDEVKKQSIEILDLYTYATKEKNQVIALFDNYYYLGQAIKNDPDYQKAGLNTKISEEIFNYLKEKYPDIASEYKF